ncbi:MAG: HAD family hydrolase [Haloechinothrix sp.]
MASLVLWDVDHTLVENSGVSKAIYGSAFTVLTGLAPQVPARTGGRTDRAIMRDMFADQGLEVPPWDVVRRSLEDAGDGHRDVMRQHGYAMPGAAAGVDALRRVAGVVQSLVTGNIEHNARMKLEAVGLADAIDFSIGGYGSDSLDRADLVAVAQQRATATHGQRFDKSNTVVIGDTVRDIDAGRRGGAAVIAVTSGIHTAEELSRQGPALVLPGLSDTTGLVAAISGLTRHNGAA